MSRVRDERGEVGMGWRTVAGLRFMLKIRVRKVQKIKNKFNKNGDLEKNKNFAISKIFTGSLRFADYRRWGHVNEYWNFF